jgi:hypothetical protein
MNGMMDGSVCVDYSNLTAQPASAGLGRLGLLGAEESLSLFLSVFLSLVEAKTCAFSKLINHRS